MPTLYRGYPAKKGPIWHALAGGVGPFWQDTLDIVEGVPVSRPLWQEMPCNSITHLRQHLHHDLNDKTNIYDTIGHNDIFCIYLHACKTVTLCIFHQTSKQLQVDTSVALVPLIFVGHIQIIEHFSQAAGIYVTFPFRQTSFSIASSLFLC